MGPAKNHGKEVHVVGALDGTDGVLHFFVPEYARAVFVIPIAQRLYGKSKV